MTLRCIRNRSSNLENQCKIEHQFNFLFSIENQCKIEHLYMLLWGFWACLPSDPLLIVLWCAQFFGRLITTGCTTQAAMSAGFRFKQWKAMEGACKADEGRSQGVSLPAPPPPSFPSPCHVASSVMTLASTWGQVPQERLAIIPASPDNPGPGIW